MIPIAFVFSSVAGLFSICNYIITRSFVNSRPPGRKMVKNVGQDKVLKLKISQILLIGNSRAWTLFISVDQYDIIHALFDDKFVQYLWLSSY